MRINCTYFVHYFKVKYEIDLFKVDTFIIEEIFQLQLYMIRVKHLSADTDVEILANKHESRMRDSRISRVYICKSTQVLIFFIHTFLTRL